MSKPADVMLRPMSGRLMNRTVYASSKSDEYETPDWFFRWCRYVWGPFDLDPAATTLNAKCQACYSLEMGMDGLVRTWDDARVWCNPPYSQISKWVARGADHAALGGNAARGTALFLVPARTDTRWWHDHAMRAAEIVLLKGRLKFKGAPSSAPFPSALLWFAPMSGLSGPRFSTADLKQIKKDWNA